MPEEIAPGLYRLSLPLPMPSLKSLNSYLLVFDEGAVLVDAGLGRKGLETLKGQLSQLGLRLSDLTSVVVTHFHIDHIGLAFKLKEEAGAEVMLSAVEWELIQELCQDPKDFLTALREELRADGVPEGLLSTMLTSHPMLMSPESFLELEVDVPLKDRDAIRAGDRSLQVLLTPGHSPGHLCLYETREKLLFSGDHVLPDITPNITGVPGREGNALKDYLRSLERVEALEAKLVLPGHRSVFSDLGKRVEELRAHHERRLAEVLRALARGPATVYEIASKLSWDVPYPDWDTFPPYEKFFAVGEAKAHVKFLVERGQVEETYGRDGLRIYKLL